MTTYVVDDPAKRFFLHQGVAIESLEHLFEELQTMSPHQFDHHVNNDRHDFSVWVKDVFDDRFLAKQMKKATSIEDLQKTIFISLFR